MRIFRFFSATQFFLVFLAINLQFETLHAEHASSSNRGIGQRSTVKEGTSNCLAELNAEQMGALSRIREMTGGRFSPEEMVERALREINNAKLNDQQRGAVAALAFGELNRAARIRMQDPNGEFKDEVQKLIQFGARSTGQGLDLKQLDFTKLEQFKDALEKLFPESKTEIPKINQADNRTPVVLGNYIVLGKQGWGNSPQRVRTLEEHKTEVGNRLQIIQAAFRNYQESSNAANSAWNLMGSIFRRGPSEAERNADKDYNHLKRQIDLLVPLYDYPVEKAIELRNQVSQELQRGNRNIDSALNQVYWAAGAIAAAPLAWPILAIGGTSAAIGMGTSVAFSASSIVGNAAIATSYQNGDLACNLGKQLLAQGPQAMLSALAAGTVGLILPGASRLTGDLLRRIVGQRVLDGISLTAQGALLAPGLYHTRKSLISVSDLVTMAEAAEADGEMELGNEYRRLAAEARLSVAQGIAATVVLPLAARYMSGRNFTFDQKKAEQLLGRKLTLSEKQVIERAHRIGDGQIGRDGKTPASVDNYTGQQLQDKYRVLAEAGFDKQSIKKLMDAGVVGKAKPTPTASSGSGSTPQKQAEAEYNAAIAGANEPVPGYLEFRSFNKAMKAAIAWLKSRGYSGNLRDFQSIAGKNKSEAQLPNNLRFYDEQGNFIQIRIEVAPLRSPSGVLFGGEHRAHINVSFGKEKGPHFLLPGGQSEVDAILRQLGPTFGHQ